MAKKPTVVCWHPGREAPELPRLRTGTHAVELLQAASLAEARETLNGLKEAALLLTAFSAEVERAIKDLRAESFGKGLPIFLALRSEAIDRKLQERANALDVEVLPLPNPEGRFWSYLREAAVRYGRRSYRAQPSRRRYFRMPLKVTAFTAVEVQTVDIGPAGIQFLANHAYQSGDTGRLEIPSLSDLVGGMLDFEVVGVEKSKVEGYEFRVNAKFTNIDFETMRKLGETLLTLEP